MLLLGWRTSEDHLDGDPKLVIRAWSRDLSNPARFLWLLDVSNDSGSLKLTFQTGGQDEENHHTDHCDHQQAP